MSPQQWSAVKAQLFRAAESAVLDRRGTRAIGLSLVLGIVLIVALLTIAYLLTARQVIVYPVVYNQDGVVLWAGPAGSVTLPDAWTGKWLAEWVGWARGQPDDPVVQGQWRAKALAMTDGVAHRNLQAFFAAVDAQARQHAGNPVRVKVEVQVLEKESPTTYHLTWRETWAPTWGTQAETHQMSGRFTVAWRQTRGTTALQLAALRDNPKELYVTFYDWAPVMEGKP